MKKIPHAALILFILILPGTVTPQMPDWKYFKDREGNSYYYDRTFKIRIAETPEIQLIPVTEKGIDYYFNTGVELINEKKYPEGLFYLKSIRTLGSTSSRIRKVQIESAKWMNYLEKKHGTRYELYDMESAITLTGENDRYYLTNSKLFYGMTIAHRPRIIKKEWKYRGTGYGLKFGVKVNDKGDYQGFDYIAGIESRILKGGAPTPHEAQNIWVHELGVDSFSRKEIIRRDDRILYDIKYPGDAQVSGVEGVYVSRNRIHLARVFYHDSLSADVYESAKLMLQYLVFSD
jgi:hypothetical protein